MARLWPWALGAGLLAWLLLLPGSVVIEAAVGVPQPDLVISVLILAAIGLLLVTIVTGLVRDAQRQNSVRLDSAVNPALGSAQWTD